MYNPFILLRTMPYLKIVLFLFALFQQSPQEHDTLIKNGKVLDGTGNPWIKTDIAITNGHITAMGDFSQHSADRIIDATGLFVTPGFIDTHSHAAGGLSSRELSGAIPQLKQGITTVVINPDGGGAVDLSAQQKELTKYGLGINVGQLVPHGSIRRDIMGLENRVPTSDELRKMKDLVKSGMEAGALGLSTGLFYTPASYAETDEIIALASIAESHGGVHQSHIRDESDYSVGVVEAVREIIDISEATGIIGVISHIKALGPNVWGASKEITELINNARSNGVQIFADQYPYEASATSLMAALVPSWAAEGGRQDFLKRLEDSEKAEQIRSDMNLNLQRRGGAERISMRHVSFNRQLEGLTLQEIADQNQVTAVDTAINLLKEGSPGIVSFNMHADDIEHFMKQPWTITASDGGYVKMGDGVPHPRNYGTFPRRIRTYSLEKQVDDLSSAIRSMTSLPASVYGLTDRGILRPGLVADITIFDPDQIRDKAIFTDPHQLSEGVEYVFVNGIPAIYQGKPTSNKSGTILKRESHKKQ